MLKRRVARGYARVCPRAVSAACGRVCHAGLTGLPHTLPRQRRAVAERLGQGEESCTLVRGKGKGLSLAYTPKCRSLEALTVLGPMRV